MVVHKEVQEISKAKARQGATISAYCILSCYTDLPLKGILLPLTYSEIDSDGNVTISFNYRSGETGYFKVPACDLTLIKNIEQYAKEKADKQPKKYERLLLARTSSDVPYDWEGISLFQRISWDNGLLNPTIITSLFNQVAGEK